jgi:hypothetical protein
MTLETSRDRLDTDDPLDTQLQRLPAAPASRWGLRSRLALGLSPVPRSGLALLALGLALGPQGLNLLSPRVLSYLDPALSVALAALGGLVGLGLHVRQPREARFFAASSLEAAITTLVVGVGIAAVAAIRHPLEPWIFALLVGICAASSSTTTDPSVDDRPAAGTRIGDLDDVLPIILGGFVLAIIRDVTLTSALSLTVIMGGIALGIALAGWLLVGQTVSESEQHVFVAGTLLLVGGATAYLSQSALFGGLVAGVLWNVAGGPARERISRDIRYLQHPLIVLLLLAAGARFEVSENVVTMGVVYLVCRTAGKLVGGRFARRVVGDRSSRNLGLSLLSPGVIGVAFALNALQASGQSDWAESLLAIVVIGSIASQLLSLVVSPRGARV